MLAETIAAISFGEGRALPAPGAPAWNLDMAKPMQLVRGARYNNVDDVLCYKCSIDSSDLAAILRNSSSSSSSLICSSV